MDSKRPDVQLDDHPDEEGRVTDRRTDAESAGRIRARVREFVRRVRESLR